MDKMKALGLLEKDYGTTEAFVNELQKHLKIAKRCDANHITECWGTDKVIASNGEDYTVSDAKKGKNIGYDDNENDNVALVLADGAPIILTYNFTAPISATAETQPVFESLPVGFGKQERFAYRTNSTGHVDFISTPTFR